VAQAATARGIKVIDSRTFAHTLLQLTAPAPRQPSADTDKPERLPDQSEVDEWLRLFGEEEQDNPA
jgi:hypothetical protein